MNTSRSSLGRKAAVVGSLALAGGIGALAPSSQQALGATVTLTGADDFLEVNTTTNSTYTSTQPPGTSSFPYILSREYFTNSGTYEILPFLRINTSTVTLPVGEVVSGAKLGIFWSDSNYGGPAHSDFVDLWSVADPVTAQSTMTTSNGITPWSDGFDAGTNGYLRTGPAGRAMDFLWDTDAAVPGGTPSNKIINQVQEYKVFSSANLDGYLTAQILAGEDSYFVMTNSNDSGFYQRFVSTSDPNIGGNFVNQPFLEINTAIPEPATGLALLGLCGTAALRRQRRRRIGEG